MSVLVVYAEASDAHIQSYSPTSGYANARAGSGGDVALSIPDAGMDMGQYKDSSDYLCAEAFLDFNTSALGAGATISAVAQNTTHSIAGAGTVGHVYETRLYDFGAGVTTADWVPGASLSANTLLATFTGVATIDVGYDWTDVAYPANINKTGSTRVLLCAKNQTDNVAPTANHLTRVYPSETAGTTKDPELTITYTTGVTHDGAVSFAGAGSVAVVGQLLFSGAVAFAGAGSATFNATAPHSAQVSFAGAGSVTFTGDIKTPRLPYFTLIEGGTATANPTKTPGGDLLLRS